MTEVEQSRGRGSAAAAPRRRGVEIAILCAAGGLVGIAAAAFGVAAGSDPAESFRLAARYTARVSFVAFLPVFLASAWQRLAPGRAPHWLLGHRRGLGLGFAAMMTVHLFALTRYFLEIREWPDAATLVVGGGAFATMYAMAATSSDAAVRWLGARRWRRLHTFGLFYLWFVFTFTYVAGRLPRAPLFFAGFAALALLAPVLRFAAARSRARRAARAPALDTRPI